MADHATHTAHVEWVRAAIRDHLGLTDSGGRVVLDAVGLAELADVARRATLNWAVAAALNDQIAHAHGPDCDHG